jgi:RimJ/RimL family protein N-acetyltransferase
MTDEPDHNADDASPDDAACFIIRCIDLCDEPEIYGLLYGWNQNISESEPDFNFRILALATGWPPASYVSWTAAAYCDQKLVGLVVVTDLAQSDHGEVRLIVDDRWDRSEIPSALMKATMAWAVTQRKRELRFICRRNNWPMRNLLKKSGARLDLAFGEIVARLPLGPCANN